MLLASSGVAADGLQVSWASAERQYGKPLLLQISTAAARPALTDLDLSGLDRDFFLPPGQAVTELLKGGGQVVRLPLYARHPGQTQIPALRLAELSSTPLPVTIEPAQDDRDHTPITVAFEPLPAQVWLKQGINVQAQVRTRTPYLSFERNEAAHPALAIATTPLRRESIADGDTVHRLGWMLYAQSPEAVALQLPPLRLRRGGVITHVFYPPRLQLQVLPLPDYVPVTLPVGRLSAELALPSRLLLSGRLQQLTLTARGDGVQAVDLQSLGQQLQGDAWLRVYPFSAAPGESSAGETRLVFTVPFMARTAGIGEFPGLRLQYFNPDKGKIETAWVRPGIVLALAPWFFYLLSAALLGVVAWLALRLGRALRQRWRSLCAYGRALRLARQARTAADIKVALNLIAAAEHWPGNLTLQQWCRQWQLQYPGQTTIADELTRMQAWRYGRAPDCLPALRAVLSALCHRRYPLLRLLPA